MTHKYNKLVLILILPLFLCLFSACIFGEPDPEENEIFYIENCSDQIIYVGIDEVNRSSITNLDSLVFECVLRCKVIYPHNSKPVRSYDYNRNTFFKRYPVSKVYIVNDDMDSVLAVYPITEASLMADGWVLKYEEDTTGQQ